MNPKKSRFSLLPRKKNSDKRSYGHVFLLAGSLSYPGAALLVSRAASVSGAGLVTVGVPESIRAIFLKKFSPEAMPVFLPSTRSGAIASSAYSKIMEIIKKRRINVLAMGPGLTCEDGVASLVRRLVRHSHAPVVLDADGLNAFEGYLKELKRHSQPVILTPHAREFERLFGEKLPLDAHRRALLAKKLSKIYDVVLVLKGHRTLVVWHDKIFQNISGNPGMAKGGSGDVLTGILSAFLAQGLDPYLASCWAVYFHGKSGDLALEANGELSVMASDLVQFLPKAFASQK